MSEPVKDEDGVWRLPSYYTYEHCCGEGCYSGTKEQPCWGEVKVVGEDRWDDDFCWIHACEGHEEILRDWSGRGEYVIEGAPVPEPPPRQPYIPPKPVDMMQELNDTFIGPRSIECPCCDAEFPPDPDECTCVEGCPNS